MLFASEPAAMATGKMVNISACGFRVQHAYSGLRPAQVLRIHYDRRQTEARVIWVQHRNRCVECGLIQQEAYLIRRLRAGEGELFSELISPYMRTLRFTVSSILYNQADVEEVLQESLLKVIAHLDQFHLGQNLRAWLLQITTNEACKRLRKNRRQWHGAMALEEEQHEGGRRLTRFMVRQETPMQALERKEFICEVCAAVESLSEIYRNVFVLRDLHQLEMAEVASLLGINVDTANTRLHRARLQVRARLNSHKALASAA